MNAIRCPQCKATNQLSAVQCHSCQMPFSNLPQDAYISVPVEQTYEAQAFGYQQQPPVMSMPAISPDNELGSKTFFWYRIYLGVMAAFSLVAIALGAFLLTAPEIETREYSPEELMVMGYIYAIIGVIFLIVYLAALFLPRKPYNWIIGFIMMALGMTSCCTLPFVVVLLIYWIKPETQAYFGRN